MQEHGFSLIELITLSGGTGDWGTATFGGHPVLAGGSPSPASSTTVKTTSTGTVKTSSTASVTKTSSSAGPSATGGVQKYGQVRTGLSLPLRQETNFIIQCGGSGWT
jgi:hypothetical protein